MAAVSAVMRTGPVTAVVRGDCVSAFPSVIRPSVSETMRAPAVAAKSLSCVAITTVPPLAAYCPPSSAASSCRNAASRDCSGSSSSSSLLGRARAAASDSRCRCPEDRLSGLASARPDSPKISTSSAAGRHQPRSGWWVILTSSRSSRTVSPGYQVGWSATIATDRQNSALSRGGPPSTDTVPSACRRKPARQDSSVDFPTPLTPVSATTSPAVTVRSMSSRTTTLPYAMRSPRTDTTKSATG